MSETRRLNRNDTLILATHNAGKVREFDSLLKPWSITLVSAGSLNLPEPEETASDFVGNAQLKALAAARASGQPALADDSGFCVAALEGDPGIFSARWAGPEKDFAAAMQRIHELAGEDEDRRAWFVCALSLAWPDGHTDSFLGRVDGEWVWPPRGTQGFGYDPMFIPRGGSLTYGEIAPAEKDAASHRARAFEQFAAACLPLAES
ncbi:Xanthosine triphosphate pyrophosphatase [Granulibacter bethesdensis]|uniref:dITP/XTP pyrophosphatase n=1 Tax=Granulibacter bethesdensis TaxID=364410 RepID=A0AAC9KA45_9PROT|nr:RdgB/HAM1 family non-canonical purine NTP pyrophosphatase [Granulibacter bethesdensis]APH53248.1 Xanthosine triphosphate pyrophosphatase [Granulibacter bethesdensis]APH60823.1 Xanthosine triphosphate pyrophosphatase [Granulibacter bethesdensis]